jgi:hypothetical protein
MKVVNKDVREALNSPGGQNYYPMIRNWNQDTGTITVLPIEL